MRIRNLKFKNVSYGITDENALPSLTQEQMVNLLNTGKFLEEDKEEGFTFESYEGNIEYLKKRVSSGGLTNYNVNTQGGQGNYQFFERKGYMYWVTHNSGSAGSRGFYRYDGSSSVYMTSIGVNASGTIRCCVSDKDEIVAVLNNNTYTLVYSKFKNDSSTSSVDSFTPVTIPNFTPSLYYDGHCIQYNNGKFGIGGLDGKFAYSTDGGKTWTVTTPFNNAANLYCANGLFIAMCNKSNDSDTRGFYSSPDGINWTMHTRPPSDWISCIVYSQDTYVAVDANGNLIGTKDLDTWFKINDPFTDVSSTSKPFLCIMGSAIIYVGSYKWAITSDIGLTWIKSSGNVGNASKPLDLHYSKDANKVFACYILVTGVWSFDVSVDYVYSTDITTYNKNQIDSLLNSKQNALTAGENVEISDNVIKVISSQPTYDAATETLQF